MPLTPGGASRLYNKDRLIRGMPRHPQRDSNPGQVSLQRNSVPQSYSNKAFTLQSAVCSLQSALCTLHLAVSTLCL